MPSLHMCEPAYSPCPQCIADLTHPAATGFAYGFINSAYLHQGLFLVVTSYILHSDKDILSELEKIGVSLPVPDFASTTEQQCDVW